MITLYVSYLDALPGEGQEEYEKLLKEISGERQERIKQNKSQKSRKQLLGAGILLKKVFDIYGVDVSSIQKDLHGKPVVDGFHFNLSHTDGLVVCTVGDQSVGCDAERMGKAPRGIAERFFSEREKEHLHSCVTSYDETFFRMWTMKESYIKMTGEGMHLPMNRFEICFEDPIKIFRDGKEQSCYVKEYDIPGYKVTVCAKESEFSERVIVLN